MVQGGREVGEWIANDTKDCLGFCHRVNKHGQSSWCRRGRTFGKIVVELGGNNAIIISKDADLEIALIGCVFGAVVLPGSGVPHPTPYYSQKHLRKF